MNKSRFDLRALVSLTCTVDGEEKQLSVLLDGIVRQADDSIGMFYDDLCEQVCWKLPTAHAKAFLEEAEKQGEGLCEDWIFLVPDCIEQYTGLKDKNGHPICEGDIIRHDTAAGAKCWPVVFKNGCFVLPYESGDAWLGKVITFCPYDSGLVVVGNIHENPELLEDKK